MFKKGSILLALLFIGVSVPGQQPMFKALFMFNFAKHIEWPPNSNQTNFVIGILGNDEITSELKKLAAARKINNKNLVVKNVSTPSEAGSVNLFYIPKSKSSEIDKVVAYFKNEATLIISDKDGLCQKGAAINFVTQEGKMKFEINKSNIVSHNLKVDSKLISLGIETK